MDLNDKKKKLQSIKREVEDFHPLLCDLLSKLPHVIKVEYTHGVYEKGADFIVERIDPTLDETEYIGVIVKIKKITRSNIPEIERQIEECELSRYTFNGKKQIFLNEIWVITNDNITNNAQEMIHHKFKSKKIKFIDSDKLIKYIDKHAHNYWENISIKISDYLKELNAKNDEIDRHFSLITTRGKKFYIEQDIVKVENDEYDIRNKKRKRKRRYVKIDIFDAIDKEKFIIIEGGMGAGKSKLVRKLIDHYSKPSNYLQTKLLPIHVNYREFYNEYKCSTKLLIDSIMNDDIKKAMLDGSKYLIFIDGFDEKDDTIENQIQILNQLYCEVYQDDMVKILITTRPLSVLGDNEFRFKDIAHFEIAPLSLKKTIDFLMELCREINLSNRILEDLKKSPLMKELSSSPIAAILLARLINENSKELPSNMTEVYAKYLELMLGRWDVQRGFQSQKEYEASERIIMNIAEYYIDHNVEFIPTETCKQFFIDYLTPRNFDIKPEELYKKVINRSGILFEDPSGNKVLFMHRTFAEFYYSKLKLYDRSLTINSRVFEIYWMNIFFFYIGLQKDCPELLIEIMNIRPKSEPMRWLKLNNMSNFFLAGFSSPYKVVEDNLYKILIDAAKLYSDILSNNIDSPFASFPPVQLLWWVQYLIRDSYAYEFFEKALEDTILHIESSDEPDDIKAYALFFTSVISIELGKKDPLDYLLDQYGDKLPVNLKIGVFCEGKDIKEQSAILKKQLKRIHRSIKNMDKSLFYKLFKNPISRTSIPLRKIT